MFDNIEITAVAGIALGLGLAIFIMAFVVIKYINKDPNRIIIMGFRRKNQKILRTDSREVRKTYIKVEFWQVLCLVCVFLPLGFIIFWISAGGWNLSAIVGITVFCVPTAIVSAIMRHRHSVQFHRLADEAGAD